MKRLLPVLVLAFLASAPNDLHAAQSRGLNLAWVNCFGQTGATTNRDFLCDTNTGTTNTLVGSFICPANIDSLNGFQPVVDIFSSVDPLPQWWKLGGTDAVKNPAPCTGRTGQPTMSADFTGGPTGCFDYWAGAGSGGISYSSPFPNAGYGSVNTNFPTRRARMTLVFAIDGTVAGHVDSLTHTYLFKININNARTVGTPNCTGCSTPVCLLFQSCRLTQNQKGPPSDTMSGARVGGNDQVTWQGGTGADCSLVPAKQRTWGQIKDLYR